MFFPLTYLRLFNEETLSSTLLVLQFSLKRENTLTWENGAPPRNKNTDIQLFQVKLKIQTKVNIKERKKELVQQL